MSITDIIYYIAAIGAIVSLVLWVNVTVKENKKKKERILEEVRQEILGGSDDSHVADSTDDAETNANTIIEGFHPVDDDTHHDG